MKISYSSLARLKTVDLEETLSYTKEEIAGIYTLLDMSEVKVKVKAFYQEDIIHLDIDIKTHLSLECAYTLEAVDYPMHLKENADLCFQHVDEEEQNEDLIYVEGDAYDLRNLILSFIITEIPLKVVKKGAKLPVNGEGYEVISEEEYYRRLEEKSDPRFAGLDDVILDDDDEE